MKKIKGCGNDLCEAHKKKIIYKESDTFCSKCASMVFYVCKDCFTQLPFDSEKYCVRCFATHEDKKNKVKKIAARVGGGAIAVGSVILPYGKKAFDIAKKIKG